MTTPRLFIAPLAICLLHTAALCAAEPPPFEPKFWKDAPDQAKIISATYIGGKGHEWLVSGGFAPDGSIVLVGNVAGPKPISPQTRCDSPPT